MKKLLIIGLCGIASYRAMPQGAWMKKADFEGSARYGAVGFSIGHKGYLGFGYDGTYLKDFWEYDPVTNAWTQKADGAIARHSAVGFSIGTKGFVGLGLNGPSHKDLWEYDPSTNAWTEKTGFPGAVRYAAVAVTANGKAYVGLGTSGNHGPYHQDWFEYTAETDSWLQRRSFPGTARSGASGFYSEGAVYVCGGSVFHEASYFNDLWKYDIASGNWIQRNSLPAAGRSSGIAFALNGNGYYGLGANFTSGVRFGDFWKYDTNENSWTAEPEFPGVSPWAPAGFVIGPRAYVGTGNIGNQYTRDLWEWCPVPSKPLSITGPENVCVASVHTYSIPQVEGAQQYTWTLPSGWAGYSTGNSITVTAGVGSGNISVSSVNGCGQSIAQTLWVTVNICTGTEPEISPVGIGLYPNPFSTFLTVYLPRAKGEAILFNLAGEQVEAWSLHEGENRLSMTGVQKGAYFIRIRMGDEIITKRVIRD